MRILSLLILSSLLVFFRVQIKSPHGTAFKVSCGTCHSSKGWQLDRDVYSFDHNTTKLPLEGQHKVINCRQCHKSLIFNEAKTECSDCHTDIHQATVGLDCSRCHTPASWLVGNINEIHQRSRFPLLGAHRAADCVDCHKSENQVRYDVLGVNCIDCHRSDYFSTTNPNHAEAGFSEDCSRCHPVNAFQWSGAGFNHAFFPLVQGHSAIQCSDCHTTGKYSDASPECKTCHQQDYLATTNPNHSAAGIPDGCDLCHTLLPGWKPASYTIHDAQAFPIYSGRHKGVWNSCTDCHTNPSNYAAFTCLNCHEHNKTEMDNKHNEITGYLYDSPSCLNCHPKGDSD